MRMPHHKAANLISAGTVDRFHSEPGPVRQNIAHHSWGVAVLLSTYHPMPSASLLTLALTHDLHEYLLGDAPFPAKNDFPEIKAAYQAAEPKAEERMGIRWMTEGANEDEVRWVKWADTVEGMLWCLHLYREFGFPYARRIYNKWHRALRAMALPSDFTHEATVFMETQLPAMEEPHAKA